ncbi:cytochrome P450 [Lentzea sp. DG1S-22]|uniref:cytochrome P450 n=1 Tax=Lentzea sp. DG1S-22 TaxID=3108822 RepID=UPI002E76BBD6|nr:cytochrome P450 [Lentzea sp. DG1S-22]WVH83356.1 cytochrome P450 [Lentzea sp. DG1S-22]
MSTPSCPAHSSSTSVTPAETSFRPLDSEDYQCAAAPSIFAELAARGPIHHVVLPGEAPAWLVTRRAEAEAALRDPRLAKDPMRVARHGQAVGRRRVPEDFTAVSGRQLMNLDGADHARIRRVITRYLVDSAVARKQTVLTETVRHHVDALAAKETADLVADFAVPLVNDVIGRVIGVRPELNEIIMTGGALLFGPDDPTTPAMIDAYRQVTGAAARAVAEGSAVAGADDLLGGLANAVRDGLVSRREAASNLAMVMIAATGGPVKMLAHSVVALHDDPLMREAMLSGDPMAVVEDLLYQQPPIPFTSWRFATETMEIAGQQVRAGDAVMVLIATANSELVAPARSSTAPAAPGERAPAERRPERNLAFGDGRHRCPGQSLARRLAATALPALFRAFPSIQLQIPSTELIWRGGFGPRGPGCVPVRLRS